jgi:hypothetical protein
VLTFPLWGPMRLVFGPMTIGESIISVGRNAGQDNATMSSEALWGQA